MNAFSDDQFLCYYYYQSSLENAFTSSSQIKKKTLLDCSNTFCIKTRPYMNFDSNAIPKLKKSTQCVEKLLKIDSKYICNDKAIELNQWFQYYQLLNYQDDHESILTKFTNINMNDEDDDNDKEDNSKTLDKNDDDDEYVTSPGENPYQSNFNIEYLSFVGINPTFLINPYYLKNFNLWNRLLLETWFCREPVTNMKDNPILLEITHFRRYGKEKKEYDFLCKFTKNRDYAKSLPSVVLNQNQELLNNYFNYPLFAGVQNSNAVNVHVWIRHCALQRIFEYKKKLIQEYQWNWKIMEVFLMDEFYEENQRVNHPENQDLLSSILCEHGKIHVNSECDCKQPVVISSDLFESYKMHTQTNNTNGVDTTNGTSPPINYMKPVILSNNSSSNVKMNNINYESEEFLLNPLFNQIGNSLPAFEKYSVYKMNDLPRLIKRLQKQYNEAEWI